VCNNCVSACICVSARILLCCSCVCAYSHGVCRYGKHLESVGDILGAVREYEAAKTHRTEVPRMLFNLRMFADLNAYIDSKADKVCALGLGRLGSACGFVDTPCTQRLFVGWPSMAIAGFWSCL
jgi:hypothetical protein